MAVPEITDEQRREYLRRAMWARQRRAQLKANMKSGRLGVKAALEHPDAQRMRVSEFLAAMPGCGKTRARAVMDRIGISPRRRVQGLVIRQRLTIIEMFSEE